MAKSTMGAAINAKIPQYFHQLPHHRYWLAVVHYQPDQQFNYFFYVRRLGVSTYSYPLGGEADQLAKLKATLATFRRHYQFPIHFVNFPEDEVRKLRRWYYRQGGQN